MSVSLVKGQKLKLADLLPGASTFEVGLQVVPGGTETVDVACFGLDAAGKLSDERYFVFYNQKRSPEGAVVMGSGAFAVDLGRLPATIERLVFTAALEGAGTLAGLRASRWELGSGGRPLAVFPFSGADFGAEKAIMVAEIYRREGGWRVAAVGQGFQGGLSALLKHFGGVEIPARPAAPPPVPVSRPATPAPMPVVAPPPAPAANLTKVTLEKRGASKTVNLRKGGGNQPIAFNLKWDQAAQTTATSGGGVASLLGFGRPAQVDLDLGCMFLLRDGTKRVIQPIGGYFGSRTQPPYIFLDKDDRTGAAADGENLTIFRPDLIERVLVFALIYEGTANFSHVHGRLRIREQDGSEIAIRLDNPDPTLPFCAICLVRRVPDGVEVVKEERYFGGHQLADGHYRFGFHWTRGTK